jgi:hypothetical protein
MARTGNCRNRGKKAADEEWQRWQMISLITRIVIEIMQPLLDRFLGGGPGRLP